MISVWRVVTFVDCIDIMLQILMILKKSVFFKIYLGNELIKSKD